MVKYDVGGVVLTVAAEAILPEDRYLLHLQGDDGRSVVVSGRYMPDKMDHNTLNAEERDALEYLWIRGALSRDFSDMKVEYW